MAKSFVANIPITISWTDTGLRNITLLSDLFVLTLYNVCSVHRGTFSTLEDVQYTGGYHEYIGGIP